MSKEVVMHGWQLVWFAFGNQAFMLAAILFLVWIDKRSRANRCKSDGCSCTQFEHTE